MAETKQKRPRKRDPLGTAQAVREDPVLDLRELARSRQRVVTSVGSFPLRRISELSALERAVVTEALEAAEKVARGVAEAEPGDSEGFTSLADAAGQVEVHENRILELALVGVTPEQLESLPGPERMGVISAFFGAGAAQIRRAVQAVASMRGPSIGARSSPASKGSSAATRRAG